MTSLGSTAELPCRGASTLRCAGIVGVSGALLWQLMACSGGEVTHPEPPARVQPCFPEYWGAQKARNRAAEPTKVERARPTAAK